MTNKKEIIINGIDVSECIFHSLTTMGYVDYNYCKCFECVCECHNDCYYKQRKRKEQECDELKEEIDYLKEIIQRHDNDNNALLSEFEDDLVDYYRRYKECLTEIKEIAENMNNECFYDDFDCKDCDMKNGCTYRMKIKILQKISEATLF